ncbi:MerR family transcriptional regulator [Anaerocolumna sedimenticola]|uniref:MerR family transcriptional regulator n=1 Tax=Anaerocolumna sedimenticola TaxID=2696063 RepID=A0A6P1TK26_9FIRM|nr:MerR family transcriptional regulator [Anaerocolumna sedimenticola]QHQ60469.1 MerR family transcriptional regulator [Anaerocolumna sedimenticola]
MFKIGDFAKLNRVTVAALRHYDAIGLLRPETTDNFTGYRYYSVSQMPKLNRIITLKELGFSLDEISLILNHKSGDTLKLLLQLKYNEIKSKLEEEQSRLTRIETFMKLYEQEDYIMKYDIVLKSIDEIKVAGLRDFIPSYSEQGHLWMELGEYLGKKGVKTVPPCMVIYYDPGYKEDKVDAEIIEPIMGDLEGNDRIKVRNLESVKQMACVVHKGSYQTLSLAYNALSKWIEENGYTMSGPQRELYLKGEWDSKNPDEYITEIQIPVSVN